MEIWTPKIGELGKLRKETKEIFSKIGTEKSRQRLVYELLNSLKSRDWNRFKFLVVKNVNSVVTNEEIGSKAKEYSDFLGNLLDKYETEENFEKIAYAVIIGIIAAGEEKVIMDEGRESKSEVVEDE